MHAAPSSSRPPDNSSSASAYQPPLEPDFTVADQSSANRSSKKKGRNATARHNNGSEVHEEITNQSMVADSFPPVERPQTILGQIPSSFGSPRTYVSSTAIENIRSTEKVSESDPARTDAWAQAIPFGRSPPLDPWAGRALSGSPPVRNGDLGRGGFSTRSPPVSPAQRKARPVSYGGVVPPLPTRQTPVDNGSRYTPSAYGSPPAPHLPQPHFYHARDVGLGGGQGMPQALVDQASFVRLCSLPDSEAERLAGTPSALLAGFNGRLDVFSASPTKVAPIGGLQGLQGTVVDAALLTWDSGQDPFAKMRPLVAIVIHGPKVEARSASGSGSDEDTYDDEAVTGMPARGVYEANGTLPEYQTRVDVYSLATQSKIVTLLKLRPETVATSFPGHPSTTPSPTGELMLESKGNYLCVASGVSGEIYIYSGVSSTEEPTFECIGKFWTSVQSQTRRRESSHSRSRDSKISPADVSRKLEPTVKPLASLSGRWLAICPPGAPLRPTISATVPSSVARAKSVDRDAHAAPPRPSVDCEVDSPDVETLLGRVARGVAQEVVRGAKWLGDQGVQTWNLYWKKDAPPASPPPLPYNPGLYSPQQAPAQFPPTHASESQTVSRDPDLVTLIDLRVLHHHTQARSKGKKMIATFQPPGGCSFLSFTPNGLGLLTASRQGDVQYVWDLLQVKNCRTAAFLADPELRMGVTTPHVRQIAKFPRLTSSTIVDVLWESPNGDRLALLTTNGTLHVFDLPLSAFRWPPSRRRASHRTMSAPSNSAANTDSSDAVPSTGYLASALSLASKTPPMLASWRGRAPSLSGGFAGIGSTGIGLASATGVKGSKAVASGISKSFGAATGTVKNIRHAGETRLHLRSLAYEPVAGRVMWSRQGKHAFLSVLDGAFLRSYQVKQMRPTQRGVRQQVSVFGNQKVMTTKLPDATALNDDTQYLQETEAEQPRSVTGFWEDSANAPPQSSKMSHPLSHAEIETNAPYQPFHSDPRVSLFVYSESSDSDKHFSPTVSAIFTSLERVEPSNMTARWAFGNDISCTKLNVGSSTDQVDSVIYRETTAIPSVSDKSGGSNVDQIVSTTRRKKGKKLEASRVEQAGFADDGFFEDDCDVLDFAADRV